jgi:transcriptional regulator GlxA family with amidase domain
MALRRARHGNLDALIAQSGHTSCQFSLDRGPPFEFETEFAKEINRRAEVVDDYGRLDVLVNNAGIADRADGPPGKTSACVTSGIDLALSLIEQDAGRKVAIEVARMPVVYLKRAGGQSQYSALLAAQAQSDSDSFSQLEQWIGENLKSDLRVEALAERVHMSPRNFARLYAKTRGRTPAKAVEAVRVDAARRQLEETTDRIATIAEACGVGEEEQMRTAFIRVLGVPPREYRKHFAST